MSRPPCAWVLNLDAEHELEAGARYAPTRHLRAIVARERRRLVGNLVAPGDVLVTEEDVARAGPRAAQIARGLPGLAWSPTPRALSLLAAAGALPRPAPELEVLRRVNARPFAAHLRAPLARESFKKHVALTLDDTLAQLAHPAPDGWLVRRTFGAAGRGRRRMASGRPSDAERAWLVASLRRGPLVLEPWVRVLTEYTRSGWVSPQGEVSIAAPCFQETTRTGAWTRTERAAPGELARRDDERLAETAQLTGEALAAAGYHGPFGIDAYRHTRPDQRGQALNPLSEINARFTMDWLPPTPPS